MQTEGDLQPCRDRLKGYRAAMSHTAHSPKRDDYCVVENASNIP